MQRPPENLDYAVLDLLKEAFEEAMETEPKV